MSVRMKDIAEDLGVSLMTVSKALRNHQDVGAETRRRVLQRAKELKYQPNLLARGLASRRTFLIGLIVPDMMHSFFAEVARGIGDKLEPQGYQILIANSAERADRELQQIRSFLGRSVDGLIVASAADRVTPQLSEALAATNARYVFIDRTVVGLNANYVGVDNEEIGYLATSHLIEQGCTRIAHIRGPAISTGTGRWSGYRRALESRGFAVSGGYTSGGEYEDAAGYSAMRRLLELQPRPDGVFCYNDPVAAGAMKAILEAGLRIPQDVAVIGAGNVHYSDLLRVPLSTIDQSSALIGRTSADLLMNAMQTKEAVVPRRILFSPQLIVRASSQRKQDTYNMF
ncbi:MAG: LacI family DNA-binding transcriptional regulator [Bryobacteraceae bacterium]